MSKDYAKTDLFAENFDFMNTAYKSFIFMEAKQANFCLFKQLTIKQYILARQIPKVSPNHSKGFRNE